MQACAIYHFFSQRRLEDGEWRQRLGEARQEHAKWRMPRSLNSIIITALFGELEE